MKRLHAFLSTAIVFLALGWLPPAGAQSQDRWLVFTQEPLSSGADLDCLFCRPGTEGSRIVIMKEGKEPEVLSKDFHSAADPTISFSGTRVLFAGKRKAEDTWDIWEISATGAHLRRLTWNQGDCRDPLYLAKASVTPPTFETKTRWIAYSSTGEQALAENLREMAPSLYVKSLEEVPGHGIVTWRTSYNLEGDAWPTVMADGRVLFASRQRGRSALMTITWAGDNLNPFYGMHEGPSLRFDPAELPDRQVVFVESDGPHTHAGGRLARVSLERPLSSHQIMSADGGSYRTPRASPEGDLVVSWRGSTGTFGIYRFNAETGRPGDVLYDDPDWHDVDAQALLPYAEPAARIPMLEFASVLDIEGFEGAGQLHCMSVYDSVEPEIRDLPRGTVRWARFVQGYPAEEGTGDGSGSWPPPSVTTRVLGVAPVEEDGSFFVNIVGNTPFYIELLDKDKKILHAMKTWIWVRSGSQRGCIGCHENKELAPQNRATDALLKMKPTLITPSPEGSP